MSSNGNNLGLDMSSSTPREGSQSGKTVIPLSAEEVSFATRDEDTTETSEVPVAAKTAKVVEEVVVNKGVQQRTETVRDSVRRSDVEVKAPSRPGRSRVHVQVPRE